MSGRAAAAMDLLRAVALRRGWHYIDSDLETALTHLLQNGRSVANGSELASLSAAELQLARAYSDTLGPGFWNWLASAMGDVDDGIVLLFSAEDLAFLRVVVESGGDAAKIQQFLARLTPGQLQALLGLGGAGVAGARTGANLTEIAERIARGFSAGPLATGSVAAGTTGDPARDELLRQAQGIYDAQTVALGDMGAAFGGMWERFDQDQSMARIIAGEFWSLFSSPTTTYFRWWQELGASGEYLTLLQNHSQDFSTLLRALNDAIQALRGILNGLNEAGVNAPSSMIGGRGVAQLRELLQQLDDTFTNATPAWQDAHRADYQALRAQIVADMEALAELTEGLQKLAQQLPQFIAWLESLSTDPVTGAPRGSLALFNPDLYVRLASVGLFLRLMADQAFLLDTGHPLLIRASLPEPVSAEAQQFINMSPSALRLFGLSVPPGGGLPPGAWENLSDEQKRAYRQGLQEGQEEAHRQMGEDPPDRDPDYDYSGGGDLERLGEEGERALDKALKEREGK
jgi:hypothetical protein